MAELEEKNGSMKQKNPRNPLPSSVASLASVFQNAEFVPFIAAINSGCIKHSLTLPAHSGSHVSTLSQADRSTSISSSSPKGHSVANTTFESKKRFDFSQWCCWVIKWHFK